MSTADKIRPTQEELAERRRLRYWTGGVLARIYGSWSDLTGHPDSHPDVVEAVAAAVALLPSSLDRYEAKKAFDKLAADFRPLAIAKLTPQ